MILNKYKFYNTLNQEIEKSCNSEIACNIQKMKNEGLFNDLLNGKSRSAISSEEQEKRLIT